MKNLPLVSVIIPSYNHQDFICSAIEAVLNQTYPNIELIVIDDGSTDLSVAKINKLKEKYNFFFIHRENKGVARTLNEGLKLIKGEYFAFCASDDLYHPNRISLQLQSMLDNKVVASYTKSFVFDDLGNVLEADTKLYNQNLKGGAIFGELLTFQFVPPVTFMYQTSFFKECIGEFDPNLVAEDFDLTLRIAEKHEILFLDEFLYYYRSPRAVGGERVRNVARLDVSESHYKSIERYKTNPLYKVALKEWNFRRFIMFSGYKQTKKYAVAGMLRSMGHTFSWLYCKAIIRIIFFWKDYR